MTTTSTVRERETRLHRILLAHFDDGAEHHEEERAAFHQAGHALVFLLEGIAWRSIEVPSGDSLGILRLGPDDSNLAASSREQRVRMGLGGIISELTALGSLESPGCTYDLRVACARFDIDPDNDPDWRFKPVLDEIKTVRDRFHPKPALMALRAIAHEVFKTGAISRDECVKIARSVPPGHELDDTWLANVKTFEAKPQFTAWPRPQSDEKDRQEERNRLRRAAHHYAERLAEAGGTEPKTEDALLQAFVRCHAMGPDK